MSVRNNLTVVSINDLVNIKRSANDDDWLMLNVLPIDYVISYGTVMSIDQGKLTVLAKASSSTLQKQLENEGQTAEEGSTKVSSSKTQNTITITLLPNTRIRKPLIPMTQQTISNNDVISFRIDFSEISSAEHTRRCYFVTDITIETNNIDKVDCLDAISDKVKSRCYKSMSMEFNDQDAESEDENMETHDNDEEKDSDHGEEMLTN